MRYIDCAGEVESVEVMDFFDIGTADGFKSTMWISTNLTSVELVISGRYRARRVMQLVNLFDVVGCLVNSDGHNIDRICNMVPYGDTSICESHEVFCKDCYYIQSDYYFDKQMYVVNDDSLDNIDRRC